MMQDGVGLHCDGPRLIDCTLREGQQAPGVRFDVKATLHIGRLLAEAGVDMIECSHPAATDMEHERLAALVRAQYGPPVLGHARANPRDVEAVAATGAEWVGIFLGINVETQTVRLGNRSVGEILDLISESVEYAVRLGLKVRYTVEDASRTPLELLHSAYRRAIDAGALRITISDTVGCYSPREAAWAADWLLKTFPGQQIETHLHDDRGLSMANALAAIEAGAHWVSCSINGLGERCGITDTASLMANLQFEERYQMRSPQALHELSRVVAAYSRAVPDSRRPVVGHHAFTHIAKLHMNAMSRDWRSYSWIDPAVVGRQVRIGHESLPDTPAQLVVRARQIPATELKFHRNGPGSRHVMIDNRFVKDARQYCIVRDIPQLDDYGPGHVDVHVHYCDSLFIFAGRDAELSGLTVEVILGDERFEVQSPAAVFIPAGVRHSYKVVAGAGLYVNHVLAGDYNGSLLDVPALPASA